MNYVKEEIKNKLVDIFDERFKKDYGDECEEEVFDEDFKEYISEIIWEDYEYDLLVEFSEEDWNEVEDKFYELRDEELRRKIEDSEEERYIRESMYK